MINMAPLSKSLRLSKVVLFCCFVVFTLFASSLLVLATSNEYQSKESHLFLGRRGLLGKNDVDDDDFLVEVVPRKEKSSVSSDNDDGIKLASKKKKSSSDSEDDEIVAPKKKKSSSNIQDGDEIVATKKKKSSSDSDNDEILPLKKKKYSSKLEDDDEIQVPKKKKSSEYEELQVLRKKKSPTLSISTMITKNQTKISKSTTSTSDSSTTSKKDQTKLVKPTLTLSKNKTKLIKPASKNVVDSSSDTPKLATKLKKLNSTSSTPSKPSNSAKSATKKSLEQLKSNSSNKNNPKSSTEKSSTTATESKDSAKKSSKTSTYTDTDKPKKTSPQKPQSPPSWAYQDDAEESDLVQEFRDLPNKFHQTFIPDLHKISTTSKVYINKYNKEITKGFKPYVGNKYASTVATAISCTFIIVPFILVSLLFNQIKAYFSLQKLIIFIQIYLSIYFSILCFSSLITGLEPLRFFYATSQSTYVWLQVLQTLAYVLYLLLLLMYLVLVFSTDSDMGQKFLGLGQTFVGFAVGLHYYMTVFHRVVLRQPPKTTWKVHAIYATCFLVICLLARAERRKVEDKKS